MATISGKTTPQQIRDFERQMTDLGSKHIPRAVQFALNGVAIEAQKLSIPMLQKALSQPTPWTLRAFKAQTGNLNVENVDAAESSLVVQDQQSFVFKYLTGDSINERQAGDVGPAEKYDLVPQWKGLAKAGITRNASGNLPRTAIAKLIKSRNSFWGSPRGLPLGLWMHGNGKRGRDHAGRFTNSIATGGGLTLLLLAKSEVAYKPILTLPIQAVAEAAMAKLPDLLARQLDERIAHNASKSS